MIKTIKNLLITGFICGIIIGNSYTEGMNIFLNEIGTQNSQIDNGFKMTVYGNGTFNTSYLGDKKNILAFSEYNYFFRTNNEQPFISQYYPGSRFDKNYQSNQGTIDNYLLCDNFNTTTITNCTNINYTQGSGTVKSIMGNINKYIYGTFLGSNSVGENYQAPIFCFNSDDYGKSICFYQCAHPNCGQGYGGSETIGGVIPPRNMLIQENNDRNFNEVPNDVIGNDQYTPNNTPNINSNVICPTIAEVMKNMGENYKTGLCYNSTLYFNGESIETIEKEDIFTIFNNDYDEYINRDNIYRNNCKAPATQQQCNKAFSGEFKKYSIIANAINSNTDEKRLRNYCNMGLNYDPNATTCVASGYIKEEYTNEDIIETIINRDYNIIKPNEGTVYDDIINDENDNKERDIFGSIENIYTKITGMFRGRNGVNGIIPDYIMRICFLTILFTILFKK